MRLRPLAALTVLLLLAGCTGTDRDTRSPQQAREDAERERFGTIGGEDGIAVFGFGRARDRDTSGGGVIGVNAFLWRASLETLDFMPLTSADPFGGVIITDWYQPEESPDERFKVTAYILDRALRADGLRVVVHRQARDSRGEWVDAAVEARTATSLEDRILTRARELRVASIAASS